VTYLKRENSGIRARQEAREQAWQGDDATIAFISRLFQLPPELIPCP
jgi:hypothetical protein